MHNQFSEINLVLMVASRDPCQQIGPNRNRSLANFQGGLRGITRY